MPTLIFSLNIPSYLSIKQWNLSSSTAEVDIYSRPYFRSWGFSQSANQFSFRHRKSHFFSAYCQHFLVFLCYRLPLNLGFIFRAEKKQDCDQIFPEEFLLWRYARHLHKTNTSCFLWAEKLLKRWQYSRDWGIIRIIRYCHKGIGGVCSLATEQMHRQQQLRMDCKQ